LTVLPTTATLNSGGSVELTATGATQDLGDGDFLWTVSSSDCEIIGEKTNKTVQISCKNTTEEVATATAIVSANEVIGYAELTINPVSAQIFPPEVTANSGDLVTFKFAGQGNPVWEVSDSRCSVVPVSENFAATIISRHATDFSAESLASDDLVVRLEYAAEGNLSEEVLEVNSLQTASESDISNYFFDPASNRLTISAGAVSATDFPLEISMTDPSGETAKIFVAPKNSTGSNLKNLTATVASNTVNVRCFADEAEGLQNVKIYAMISGVESDDFPEASLKINPEKYSIFPVEQTIASGEVARFSKMLS
jgi:hypothetical protein